jgi:peptidoglycan/xylan/chitin deacetylase (PgdA/CDA1 family)
MNTPYVRKTGETVVIGDPGSIKVLAYHRIVKDDHIHPRLRTFATNVEVFRSHLRILERGGFTAITFRDYDLYLRGELNLPQKPVIISFDDGYRDTHEVAYPILREYGMTATVFVVAAPTSMVNYWDPCDTYVAAPLMSQSQILELHQGGIEIGSHSLTHARLTEVPREQAWDEITRSRMLLEILLNSPVRSFCYPYGLVNRFVRDVVQQAGYTVGVGVYSGPPRFGQDHFNIRRIHPSGSNFSLGFRTQMMLPYERYSWAKFKMMELVRSSQPNSHANGNGAGHNA